LLFARGLSPKLRRKKLIVRIILVNKKKQKSLVNAVLIGKKRLMSNDYIIPKRYTKENSYDYNDLQTMHALSLDD